MFGAFPGDDLEDDPLMGFHARAMNQMSVMMNSVMSETFGNVMGGMGMGMGMPMGLLAPGMMPLMPRPRGLDPFMAPPPPAANGLSFSSSSVTSMTMGPDGRPQVYRATSTTKAAPGGVRETTRTVQDSKSGVKKMAVGHHLGPRAHIVEKSQDTRTGQFEENVQLVNLSDDETEEFNHEWETATRGYGSRRSAVGGQQQQQRRIAHYGGVTIEDVTEDTNRQQLALPPPPSHERGKKRDHHGSGGSSRAAKQHRSKHDY
ncbi:myeloid leukemia factor isoform X2 [Cloeon dipterum]|uniref:myeloid leukemia factor isoform X2 n=1 Tax=Cloeon dipterum TaxID=197152 RepID=UPI0032202364